LIDSKVYSPEKEKTSVASWFTAFLVVLRDTSINLPKIFVPSSVIDLVMPLDKHLLGTIDTLLVVKMINPTESSALWSIA